MTGIIHYARWQALDFLLDRGRSSLVIVALFWLQALVAARTLQGEPTRTEVVSYLDAVLAQMVPLLAFVLVLFATNGIVAADRTSGAFRLLLGKPVSAAAYYLQGFVLHGLGMLAVAALFLLGFALLSGVAAPAGAMIYFALYYVLLGGIGFALSTVARFDWASTAAVWVGSLLVRSMLPAERGLAAIADAVLPPTSALTNAGDALMHGIAPGWADVVRVGAYGAVMVAFAVFRLRRRPFDE